MILALTILFFILGVIMMTISFILSPDSNSFSGALVGSSDLDLFKVSKERGFKKWIKITMLILGFVLMLASLLIRLVPVS